jgi:hypothetical protein
VATQCHSNGREFVLQGLYEPVSAVYPFFPFRSSDWPQLLHPSSVINKFPHSQSFSFHCNRILLPGRWGTTFLRNVGTNLHGVITQKIIVKMQHLWHVDVPLMHAGRRDQLVSPSRVGISLKPMCSSDGLSLLLTL